MVHRKIISEEYNNKTVKILKVLFKYAETFNYKYSNYRILTKKEILLEKKFSNIELLNEIFYVSEKYGLRYDLTVPFLKGEKRTGKIKRFEFGTVFRDGPTSSRRYKEFIQFDFDIRNKNITKDTIELLTMMLKILEELNIKEYCFEINSTTIINLELEKKGVLKDQYSKYHNIIDKLEKLNEEELNKELNINSINKEVFESIILNLSLKEINSINNCDFKDIFLNIKKLSVNIIFNPLLSRGFNFYNGLIYELKVENKSIIAGGQYINPLKPLSEYKYVGLSFGINGILKYSKIETMKKDGVIILTQEFYYEYFNLFKPYLNNLIFFNKPEYRSFNYFLKDILEKNDLNRILFIGLEEINEKIITYRVINSKKIFKVSFEEYWNLFKNNTVNF